MLAPGAPRGVSGPVAEILHVVHVEAQEVSEAVGEEESVSAALDQALRITPEDPDIDEALGEDPGGEEVEIAVAHARANRGDRSLLSGENDVVEISLGGAEAPRDRPGPGHVGGPALMLRPCVAEEEISLGEGIKVGGVVEHLAVDADDRVVGGLHPAQRHRPVDRREHLLLGDPRAGRGHPGEVSVVGARRGGAEELEGAGVVDHAELDHRLGERRVDLS